MLLPQMVVQDGYFVSHIAGEVEMPAAETVDEFLPPYQLPFPLDPRRPVSHGPQIHPEQGPPLQLERARAMEDAIPGDPGEDRRVRPGLRPEAYPHFVESYRLEDAELAIVISGGHAVTCRAAINRLRAQGIKIGMARLLWVRPFPSDDLREALRGVKAVGVVETNLGLGGASYGGILSLDVTTALYHLPGFASPGDIVHGRPGRRDRADGRVRLDGGQARPGGRTRPRREGRPLGRLRGLGSCVGPGDDPRNPDHGGPPPPSLATSK